MSTLWSLRQMRSVVALFSALALFSMFLLYRASSDIVNSLSPQGCRMSWMSPSYVLQSGLNSKWSPLASRYSLYLYREVGWESSSELHGSPVLFIPGNAGSSHQVRSIASSATRQFYASPYVVSSEFENWPHKSLDFFTLEFNEDLSAFHGPTLDAEMSYARAAIAYILSLYPDPKNITILGHSMGGVVATALLPHPNVSAIITMSTPHTVPPARLDRRINSVYSSNRQILQTDETPILSLCGGATDLMVPAESCVLPAPKEDVYRRTVFTSALEGAWTGVGHREMVWCHQVRWRVARAAIDLAAQKTPENHALVLDRWLRDGHTLPPPFSDRDAELDELDVTTLKDSEVAYHDPAKTLFLPKPDAARTYLMPVPKPGAYGTMFMLYLSRGSIAPIAPQRPLPLRVSVYLCPSTALPSETCPLLRPTTLKLIPEPVPGRPFPTPDEGADESEGVVVFAAEMSYALWGELAGYIAVKVEGGDGRGWLVAGYTSPDVAIGDLRTFRMLWSSVTVNFNLQQEALLKQVAFPNLLSNALLVYKLTPSISNGSTCADALLPPLLQHTSQSSETHYFPLTTNQRQVLLHSHASGPFLPATYLHGRGFALALFSSTDRACSVDSITIAVDWWASLGRWAARYAQTVISWSFAICALVVHYAWSCTESRMVFAPPVLHCLARVVSYALPRLVVFSLFISVLPLHFMMWLGNRGEPVLLMIAPLLLVICVGLVAVSWVVVETSLRITGVVAEWISRRLNRRQSQSETTSRKNALLSMGLVLIVTLIFIPWQVAFLCAWIYHFYTCATFTMGSKIMPVYESDPIPLESRSRSSSDASESLGESDIPEAPSSPPPPRSISSDQVELMTLSTHYEHFHLLLLMTWLLPITAPVLVVWVRTLTSAGMQAIWGSGSGWGADRNVFLVAPWLFLVEWAGVGGRWLCGSYKIGQYTIPTKNGMLGLVIVCLFFGTRATFAVFEAACVLMWAVVISIGPRYLGSHLRGEPIRVTP
ncbi:PGAP1-domain-containing protein [Wolfiporia cocos MD-104 SS10]|uniref:GPI inositol-deacylase n=1 Tax=Wolfiporia cocos (strain MD-104) TaxID=742152 RepID=A0A2H3JG62_WOLCO|nr:PGAP1-domain-containing protein [Wolfiporia cocos MD-104 SS10]